MTQLVRLLIPKYNAHNPLQASTGAANVESVLRGRHVYRVMVHPVPHLVGQAEGEVAVQLGQGGRQVEARERLPDAVSVALAERREALRLAPVHHGRSHCILHTILRIPCTFRSPHRLSQTGTTDVP